MQFQKKIFVTLSLVFTASMFINSCTVAPKDAAATSPYTITENAGNIHTVGRSDLTFTVKENGTPKSGLKLEVEAMMDMTTYIHTTPSESTVATDLGNGNYKVTVYYVMSGTTWQLHFHVNGVHQTDHLTVTVGGTMMNKGTLKGITDKIVDPAGSATPVTRTYHIFKSAISAGTPGSDSIDLFLATTESYLGMPAVFSSKILNNEVPSAWTVGTITLSVCNTWDTVNGTCTGWSNLTDNGNGHFTGSALTIANTGMLTFAVHLKVVNSTAGTNEWKTTGGLAGAGTGDGATEFKKINQ
ncbi:MAG: FixH family protein [Spirochaetia bacterium]|nr:FixH family protein [Spirochaetia bacterium]